MALDLHLQELANTTAVKWSHPKDMGGHLQVPAPPAKPQAVADSRLECQRPVGRSGSREGTQRGWAEHRQLLPILLIRQVSSAPWWEWETCGERPGVTVRLMGGLSVCAKRPEEKEAAGNRRKPTQLSFPTNLPLPCFFLCYPPRPPSLLWWVQLTG